MKKDYRVAVKEYTVSSKPKEKGFGFSIKEVHYDKKEIIYALEVGYMVQWDNVESLIKLEEEVSKVARAFTKPFIIYNEKNGKWNFLPRKTSGKNKLSKKA